MDRRHCLKVLGGAGLASLVGTRCAEGSTTGPSDTVGVLVDLARCKGCRRCEQVCAHVNELPMPELTSDADLATKKTTSDKQLTVVNTYQTDKGPVHVKRQCLHCQTPACTAACMSAAISPRSSGSDMYGSCRQSSGTCPR